MIEECATCVHEKICIDSYDNVSCKYYFELLDKSEPKRIKCEDGCVKERYEYIDKYDDGNFETRTVKNTYCPKCGTRIEVNK